MRAQPLRATIGVMSTQAVDCHAPLQQKHTMCLQMESVVDLNQKMHFCDDLFVALGVERYRQLGPSHWRDDAIAELRLA